MRAVHSYRHMIKLKQIIENVGLYEGLSITHPIGTSIEMLQNWGSWGNGVTFQNFNNAKILVIVNKASLEEMNQVLKISNNLGYFPSYIETKNGSGVKYTDDELKKLIINSSPFTLKLEAKYDLEVTGDDRIPNILYHITDLKFKDKIQNIGLSPRSKSKIAEHPSRIYLMFSPNDMGFLLGNPKSGIKDPCMFSVDIHKLHNRIRLFIDPNFSSKGVYTYDNISPKYLTLVFPSEGEDVKNNS